MTSPAEPAGGEPGRPAAPDGTSLGAASPDPEARALSEPQSPPVEPARPRTGGGAHLVAAGILLSRIAGLLREAVFARYLGLGLQADAFRAALRMPNVLQNLLGEGTLSASFIPVYSELEHAGRKEEAGRVAGAVFALLLAVAGLLSLIGILLAPVLVTVFLNGFEGERRALTITLTRIIFPMAGVLVLSAWALGVLNSHRRFLLPYTAPVLWNAAMIATVIFFGGRTDLNGLAIASAWGALVGGLLQFLVQLPLVLRLERELKIRWDLKLQGVRTAIANAGPALAGRGVVQLSGWFDMFLASFLAAGAVAGLANAQTLYLLPVSLFGMSIAAAELPELARQRGAGAEILGARINAGLRRTALFVVPTIVGYLTIGGLVVGAVFQGGLFDADSTAYVHLLLAAYSLGLFASTSTRLYSSAFFALHDTRTPARVATLRVVVSGAIGGLAILLFRGALWRGYPLAAAGLGLGASAGAWLEWALLRRRLSGRIGDVGVPARTLGAMFVAALAGAAAGWGLAALLPTTSPVIRGGAALAVFGAAYFPLAALLGVDEAGGLIRRFTARLRR